MFLLQMIDDRDRQSFPSLLTIIYWVYNSLKCLHCAIIPISSLSTYSKKLCVPFFVEIIFLMNK